MDAGVPHGSQEQLSTDVDDAQVILGTNGELELGDAGDGAGSQGSVPQSEDEPSISTDFPIATPTPTTSPVDLYTDDIPFLETAFDSNLPTSFFLAPTSTVDHSPSFLSIPTLSIMDNSSFPSGGVSMAPSSLVSVLSPTSLATQLSVAHEPSSSIRSRTSTSSASPSVMPSSLLIPHSTAGLSSSTCATVMSSSNARSKTSTVSSSSSFSAASFSAVLSKNHTPAATTTVYSPPLTNNPSNLNVHTPPFYIGVILGGIAGAACLIALIAWCLRRYTQARRRRTTDMVVPWARSRDLEGGHYGGNFDAAIGAMNLGSREDLANVQAWSPRGDRDVGEPRRALGDGSVSTYSLHDHPIPTYGLFLRDSLGAFSTSDDVDAVHQLRPKRTLRQLPSHLVDEELLAKAHQENDFHSARSTNLQDGSDIEDNPYLDSRISPSKPRYLGLHGNGLEVPWGQKSAEPPPRSMAERLRDLGKPPAETSWDSLPPLPTPGGDATGGRDDFEPWASSFRTSLVNAFNAVSANLSSTAGVPKLSEADVLTAPPRRKSRKSIRSSVSNGMGPSRRGSLYSVASKAWTLEEKEDGAGVVHILVPDLEKYENYGSSYQRPTMPPPNLSFGDGDQVLSYYHDRHELDCNHEPQVPLVASSLPKPAFIRPISWIGRRHLNHPSRDGSPSRGSSIYSKGSVSHIPRIPSVKQTPRLPPTRTRSLESDEGNSDSIVIQPDTISRLSSSDSSMGDGEFGDGRSLVNATAAKALKARRRKVVNI